MNTEKIDRAIDAVADMISKDPENINTETIKALAELVAARAMVVKPKNYEAGWSNQHRKE